MESPADPVVQICLVALVIWLALEFTERRKIRLFVATIAGALTIYCVYAIASARYGEHLHRQRTHELIRDALQHGQSDQVIMAIQRYLDKIATGEPECSSQWILWEALVKMKTNTTDRSPNKEQKATGEPAP